MKCRNTRKMLQRSLVVTSNLPFRAVDQFPKTPHCRAEPNKSRIIWQKAIYCSGNSLSSWNNFSQKDFLRPRGGITSFNRNVAISGKAVVDASPSAIQPYLRLMRIDRPIGHHLLFSPQLFLLSDWIAEVQNSRNSQIRISLSQLVANCIYGVTCYYGLFVNELKLLWLFISSDQYLGTANHFWIV